MSGLGSISQGLEHWSCKMSGLTKLSTTLSLVCIHVKMGFLASKLCHLSFQETAFYNDINLIFVEFGPCLLIFLLLFLAFFFLCLGNLKEKQITKIILLVQMYSGDI